MLRIAGQMAGPIGLKYFVNTQGWRYRLKKFEIFFIPRATPGPSASSIYVPQIVFRGGRVTASPPWIYN